MIKSQCDKRWWSLFSAAVLAVVLSGAASATSVTDLGTLDVGQSVAIGGSSSVFVSGGGSDYYGFELLSQADVVVDIAVESAGWILLSGAGAEIIGQSGSGASFTVNDLAADDYTLKVVYGALGFGAVGYSGTIAAVPLPAAVWLFLSAVGGLITFKRKGAVRSQNGAVGASAA